MLRYHFRLVVALLAVGVFVTARPARADEVSSAIREFKKGMRAEAWKDRIEAFTSLAFYDSGKIVDPLLDAVEAEPHGAVRHAGLGMLAKLASDEAREAILAIAAKGKGKRSALVLLALQSQPGTFGGPELIKLLGHKQGQIAGLAALALGAKQVPEAIPPLLDLLKHSEWQVRFAAARSLKMMAGDPPVELFDKHGNKVKPKKPKPWVPVWYDVSQALPPLIAALAKEKGSAREPMIACLERLTKQKYGWDLPAWKKYAAGTDPEEIKSRPKHPPYLLGVPVYGQRVVLIYDHSQPTDDPHPFTEASRLKALCTIPGGRPIPWYKLKKKTHFLMAHAKRWISDIPKGHKFEVVLTALDVTTAFGKLSPANTGTKKKAIEAIEEAKLLNGLDVFKALHVAMDSGGAKDSQAWKKGPDQIIFVNTGVPWRAKEMDQAMIGATIAMKASLRLVPITTVGVGNHCFEMLKVIAGRTGGRYVDWTK